ncbi:MAG TPA: hypothetical protein VFO66_13955 [Gemmatimonadaceae bacterium]|nr:hypothetical protein [Gemmatimonadaceae bacterium]
MRRLTSLLLGTAVTLAACSSGGSSAATQSGASTTQPAPARSSRNVLLRTELNDIQQAEMSAYQAIKQFRPNMLIPTGTATMGGAYTSGIQVFLNGNKQGGIDALNSIRMIEVEKIEHLNGSDATMRFGTGYAGGAILVTRRR